MILERRLNKLVKIIAMIQDRLKYRDRIRDEVYNMVVAEAERIVKRLYRP